MTVITMIR